MACGIFCCGARAPEHVGSAVVVSGLNCPVACGILVPRRGIEPMSPALEGGFSTTGPPGKSRVWNSKWKSFPLRVSKAWLHCLLASSPVLLEATFPIVTTLLPSIPSCLGKSSLLFSLPLPSLASNPIPSNSTGPEAPVF